MPTKVFPPLNLSDRLAQYLAWQAAKKMSFGIHPELWRTEMVLVSADRNTAKYSVSFKLDWGTYRAVVLLHSTDGKYHLADIYLIHPSVKDTYFRYTAAIQPDTAGGSENWDNVNVKFGERITGTITDEFKKLLLIE